MSDKAQVINSEIVFEGKVFTVESAEIIEPGGKNKVRRDVVRKPGASAVVAAMPGGRVLLIRQYRFGVDDFLWEIPSGYMNDGESPEQCARRELQEETGFSGGDFSPLASIQLSPGSTSDQIHLFKAENLRPGAPNPDPEERIEVREFNIFQALDMISSGAIVDAKTIAAILLAGKSICPVAGINDI